MCRTQAWAPIVREVREALDHASDAQHVSTLALTGLAQSLGCVQACQQGVFASWSDLPRIDPPDRLFLASEQAVWAAFTQALETGELSRLPVIMPPLAHQPMGLERIKQMREHMQRDQAFSDDRREETFTRLQTMFGATSIEDVWFIVPR